MKHPNILSTGQVADILGCASRTVCRLIDDGHLPGWRVPTGEDRRVNLHDLAVFCKTRHIRAPQVGSGYWTVLLTGSPELAAALTQHLREIDGWLVLLASSAFLAGALAEVYRPDVVIVDLAPSRAEGLGIVRGLRGLSWAAHVPIVALTGEDGAGLLELASAGVQASFSWPFPADRLAAEVQRMVTQLPANGKVQP